VVEVDVAVEEEPLAGSKLKTRSLVVVEVEEDEMPTLLVCVDVVVDDEVLAG